MDVFDLMAKISVDTDEYDKSLEDAGTRGTSIASKIGAGIKAGVAVGTAALGAAATGVAAITKQAVAAYSEQEQLAGGVQKIFADMDTSAIMQDAADAYKTLGLSANQYLATINDVGATFASTMGAEAGYETAKRGLQAISDYATGTGKNVDMLSEKFTMITRATSSYQSIADQFSGILPATSAAFLEQAQSAGYLEDSYKKLTEVPIEEYQAAVAQMLEQGVANLNLTGNTASEAANTLSGSAGMLKAAWQNLVAGFADPNADIGLLMQNMVASASASIDNLVPTIQQAMSGISAALVDQAPELINTFIDSITTLGPDLIDAATELVLAIADTLSTPENIEKIFQTAVDMVLSLADGLTQTLPVLIPAIVQTIVTIAETLTKPENLESLITAAVGIILALVDGITSAIPILVKSIPVIIKNILEALTNPNTLSTIISGIVSAVMTILESLPEIISILVQAIPEIIAALISAILDPNVLASLISGAVQLVTGLVSAIPQIIVALIAAAPQIIIALVKAFTEPENIRSLIEGAIQLVLAIVKAIPEIIVALIKAVPSIISALIHAFSSLGGELKKVFQNALEVIKNVFTIDNFKKWGSDLIGGFVKGIRDRISDVKDAALEIAEKVSSFLHFSEPDEGPLANFHTFAPDMMDLFAKGIRDNIGMIQDQMQTAFALPDVSGSYEANARVANGGSVGAITINVYGAEGQDEARLAEIVGDRLMHELNMRQMTYA